MEPEIKNMLAYADSIASWVSSDIEVFIDFMEWAVNFDNNYDFNGLLTIYGYGRSYGITRPYVKTEEKWIAAGTRMARKKHPFYIVKRNMDVNGKVSSYSLEILYDISDTTAEYYIDRAVYPKDIGLKCDALMLGAPRKIVYSERASSSLAMYSMKYDVFYVRNGHGEFSDIFIKICHEYIIYAIQRQLTNKEILKREGLRPPKPPERKEKGGKDNFINRGYFTMLSWWANLAICDRLEIPYVINDDREAIYAELRRLRDAGEDERPQIDIPEDYILPYRWEEYSIEQIKTDIGLCVYGGRAAFELFMHGVAKLMKVMTV